MARIARDTDGYEGKGRGTKSKFAERFAAGTKGEQPDWGRIDANLVWMTVQRLTQDDGAVMFGYSRDGGAYSIKVYAGGEPEKAYFHTDGELIDFLNYLLGD
jgi:hypothetical protein